MKKIIKLTENDLIRLVKKVIEEQELDRELSVDTPEEHMWQVGGNREEGIKEFNEHFLLIEYADADTVQGALDELPETIKFIAIINCENADFGSLDLCGDFMDLAFVNLKNTPNNFEETQAGCYREIAHNMWDFTSEN